jgi:hypothetical protein
MSKKRPHLTLAAVKARYRWVLFRKDWSFEEWATIIWSDECSVERGAGARRTWSFRTPGQKWDKERIDTYTKGKDISVMVWGAIWVGGRSDLYIMDRDASSAREGYSAGSYIHVLDDQLPTIFQPGMTFMQDNASIHRAKIVKDWFSDHAIPVLEWPPFSPDLNPIEMVWALLKEWVCTNYPDLMEMSKSEAAYQRLYSALREGWEAIPQSKIDNLIKTMDERVESVRLAKGWHSRF